MGESEKGEKEQKGGEKERERENKLRETYRYIVHVVIQWCNCGIAFPIINLCWCE